MDQQKQLQQIERNIIEVLSEKDNDFVTLAQLPSLYKKQFGQFPNFAELGFPKLKNFLQSMSDKVQLEEFHKNHIKVRLKQENIKSKLQNLEKNKVKAFLIQTLQHKRFGVDLQQLQKSFQKQFYLENSNMTESQFKDYLMQEFSKNLRLQVIENQQQTKVLLFKANIQLLKQAQFSQSTQNEKSKFEYGLQQQKVELNSSGFISNISEPKNETVQTVDEYSEECKLYQAFDYKVFSPLTSLSTTFQQENKDLSDDEEEGNFNFEITRKFVEQLIDEDQSFTKQFIYYKFQLIPLFFLISILLQFQYMSKQRTQSFRHQRKMHIQIVAYIKTSLSFDKKYFNSNQLCISTNILRKQLEVSEFQNSIKKMGSIEQMSKLVKLEDNFDQQTRPSLKNLGQSQDVLDIVIGKKWKYKNKNKMLYRSKRNSLSFEFLEEEQNQKIKISKNLLSQLKDSQQDYDQDTDDSEVRNSVQQIYKMLEYNIFKKNLNQSVF